MNAQSLRQSIRAAYTQSLADSAEVLDALLAEIDADEADESDNTEVLDALLAEVDAEESDDTSVLDALLAEIDADEALY